MVLNESMAAGTPVVAFDNPGYRTVLDGKMEYCMATLFDVEELFQKVVRILEDEKLRNELSEWGLAEVRDKYDWNKVTDRVLKVYNEIVVPAKAVA
jgi:phosphatidylinositol alpha-mannosyltransferase